MVQGPQLVISRIPQCRVLGRLMQGTSEPVLTLYNARKNKLYLQKI